MLDVVIWENPINSWLLVLATFTGLYLFLTILVKLIISRLNVLIERRQKSSFIYILSFLQHTKHFFVLVLSLYVSTVWVSLPENIFLYLRTTFMIVFWLQVGIWANHVFVKLVDIRSQQSANGEDETTMNALKTVLKIAIWSIVLILAIDNIPGVEITALITSLGIGGIAIGLALQNILGDLFSSLSISLDKPFVIKDLIKVDEHIGTVEKIGLKSTRIRSISGEQLIFSNSDLLNSRVQNFKRLERRRNLIRLGVLYQTTPEQLRKIPEIIRSIFEKIENVTLDRIHLSDFGDFSINYELVYYVENADFAIHMDEKELILLEIFDEFIKNEIEFAYPTQSIFIENPPNNNPIG